MNEEIPVDHHRPADQREHDPEPADVVLCRCCRNTEHSILEWVQIGGAAVNCERCHEACCNTRCRDLPANPDGRGYGPLPKARRGWWRLR